MEKSLEEGRGMGHCFISFKMEDMPVFLHMDGTGPVEGKRRCR